MRSPTITIIGPTIPTKAGRLLIPRRLLELDISLRILGLLTSDYLHSVVPLVSDSVNDASFQHCSKNICVSHSWRHLLDWCKLAVYNMSGFDIILLGL